MTADVTDELVGCVTQRVSAESAVFA